MRDIQPDMFLHRSFMGSRSQIAGIVPQVSTAPADTDDVHFPFAHILLSSSDKDNCVRHLFPYCKGVT